MSWRWQMTFTLIAVLGAALLAMASQGSPFIGAGP